MWSWCLLQALFRHLFNLLLPQEEVEPRSYWTNPSHTNETSLKAFIWSQAQEGIFEKLHRLYHSPTSKVQDQEQEICRNYGKGRWIRPENHRSHSFTNRGSHRRREFEGPCGKIDERERQSHSKTTSWKGPFLLLRMRWTGKLGYDAERTRSTSLETQAAWGGGKLLVPDHAPPL